MVQLEAVVEVAAVSIHPQQVAVVEQSGKDTVEQVQPTLIITEEAEVEQEELEALVLL